MKTLLSILVFLAFTITALAQSEVFGTKEGAINGYDPVAYFTKSKPIAGKKEISLMWKEQMWYFSSTENRDALKQILKNMNLSLEAIVPMVCRVDIRPRQMRRRGLLLMENYTLITIWM